VPRYKLTIEYDGSGLVGWQRQANGLSVQEALETAIHKFCGETVTVHGAGRTDAGVHALAQAAHLDLDREAAPEVMRGAVNHYLRPNAISVLAAERVCDEFDARLTALGRVYLYRILNRRAPPALERGRVWQVAPALDVEAMRAGAHHLIGHHDFSTFRDSLCQARSPLKTLDALEVDDQVLKPQAGALAHGGQLRGLLLQRVLLRPDGVQLSFNRAGRAGVAVLQVSVRDRVRAVRRAASRRRERRSASLPRPAEW